MGVRVQVTIPLRLNAYFPALDFFSISFAAPPPRRERVLFSAVGMKNPMKTQSISLPHLLLFLARLVRPPISSGPWRSSGSAG